MTRSVFIPFILLMGMLCAAGPSPAVGTSGRSNSKVHLDKTGALTQIFPEADRVVELRYVLSNAETSRIESLMSKRLEEGGFYLYVGLANGRPIGYAAIVSQIGKVKPITHIVGVTPAGTVSDVAVMIYRESHGAEVASSRFMEQYRGKTLEDPIRIDRDIINIAGATLSGHAICRGVRKALAVVNEVFLSRDEDGVLALVEGAESVTPECLSRSRESLDAPDDGGMRLMREVMGTVCTIQAFPEEGTLEGARLEEAIEDALDEVSHWDHILSNWRSDTPLSKLNDAPIGQPYQPGMELIGWLDDARLWSDETNGCFDPAVGSLVQAWKLQSKQPARPDEETLEEARDAAGLSHFLIDLKAQTVERLHVGALLDPGASGKGYALDRAAAVLRAHGVQRALLSFRSTLLAMGPPPGETAWRIPIVHDDVSETVTHVELVEGALSVSGGGLNTYADGPVLRGHVIDPRSGVPVEASRLAWVMHASAAASDALATALLVNGPTLAAVDGATGGFVPDAGDPIHDWPPAP